MFLSQALDEAASVALAAACEEPIETAAPGALAPPMDEVPAPAAAAAAAAADAVGAEPVEAARATDWA